MNEFPAAAPLGFGDSVLKCVLFDSAGCGIRLDYYVQTGSLK